jgi:hypothetical protein
VSTLGKTVALLIIVAFIMSSLVTVNAANYSNPPLTKPLVPEFSVKLVAHPYDVEPVNTTKTTIDEYTGKETTTTTTKLGYHVENQSIEVTIKNLQFAPYNVTYINDYTGEDETFINNNAVYQANLYYHIRVKGHFGTYWSEFYNNTYSTDIGKPTVTANLDSEYTVFSYPSNYEAGSSIDIQVQAVVGYSIPVYRFILYEGTNFIGEYSDWSNTQTLTIKENGATAVPQDTTATPTPTATLTPTSTPHYTNYPTVTLTPTERIEQTGVFAGLNWQTTIFAVMGAVIVGLVIALALSKRSHKPQI